jgi:signal transduction histidine kinase
MDNPLAFSLSEFPSNRMHRKGVSMPEQAFSRARSFVAGSIRSRRTDLPLHEPLDSFRRNAVRICHDLRLPLTAILANAEFLTKPRLTESESGEFYDEIRSAIDFMSEMISSLLEGSTEIESVWPMERDVVQTVERAIHMTMVRHDFREIAITHRHEGIAIGWFDSSRIERAVANLVLNACEAVSPQSGKVLVTTRCSRSKLQIDVWDNGPGIAAAIRGSIFQPFVSYGKPHGSGLGLAIAKEIVECHGGEIHLVRCSEAGTLFTISVPFRHP